MKTILLIWLTTSTLLSPAIAQKFFVEHEGKLLPLIGADGLHPVTELKKEYKTIPNGKIVVNDEKKTKPAKISVEIVNSKLVSLDSDDPQLSIELTLVSDEDLNEGCLVIRYTNRNSKIKESALFELPALPKGESTEIALKLPTETKWDGSRRAGLFALAKGKRIDLEFKGRKNPKNHSVLIRPQNARGRVLYQVSPEAPMVNFDEIDGDAYVKVTYYIDADDKVREATSDDYTHEELIEPAILSLRKSKFKAAYKDGAPTRTKVTSTIWFKRPAKQVK